MSRLAAKGNGPPGETSFPGSVRSAQDQLQGKDTPAAWLESISGRRQRDPAGGVGSIELLGGWQVAHLGSFPPCHFGVAEAENAVELRELLLSALELLGERKGRAWREHSLKGGDDAS